MNNDFVKLIELNGILKHYASKIGPQHSFWDVIAENEEALSKTISEDKLKELIKQSQEYLKDHD